MKNLNSLLLTGLFSLLVAFSSTTFAAELNAPQKVLQETSDLLADIVKNDKDKLADREYIMQLVNDVIEPRVDLEKISRLVLGKYWRTATPEQKAQFQNEFKGLLVNTYASAFTELEEWTVHFLPMTLNPEDKRVSVKTEIIQPSRPPIAVNYRMAINKVGEWKAYDVVIEGISMVTNYKSSFASSIKKSGSLENVINMLAEKNKQSEAEQLALEDNKAS